jgi:hypothetical protein
MPLMADGKGKAVTQGELRAIGFWMIVREAIPVRPVRVFVSYEALAELDPFDIRDFASAFVPSCIWRGLGPASKQLPATSSIVTVLMRISMKVCRRSD